MARVVYSWLFYLLLPFMLIRLWQRSKQLPAYSKRWKERLGFFKSPIQTTPFEKNTSTHKTHTIWFHTVSVGEFIAAAPLIAQLTLEKKYRVIVTTTTPTGSDQVKRRLGQSVFHVYAPYDAPFCVKRFLKKLKPDVAVFVETELWPNTLHYCKKNQTKTLLINARLSNKSARGYKKFSAITRPMLENIDASAIQNSADAERFYALGLNKKTAIVNGNVKFDITISQRLKQDAQTLRGNIRKHKRDIVFIAASTHEREDEIILQAFEKIVDQYAKSFLILVPRHPDRFEQVLQLCKRKNFETVTRSSEQSIEASTQILLGDSMGELMMFFGASDVAFVGGSFVHNGGHNYIEPAAWGLPILSGPSQFNFADTAQQFTAAGALTTVNDSVSLAAEVKALIEDQRYREATGIAGLSVIEKNRGATEKTLQLITRHLHS